MQADARLSDASAEAVAGYYAADYQAEEILAQLREGTVPSGVREEAAYTIINAQFPVPRTWK